MKKGYQNIFFILNKKLLHISKIIEAM